jgi:hypothetical protein
MTTNRTPLRRSPLPKITLRAVEIFTAMERARARRRRPDIGCRVNPDTGMCKASDDNCRACSEWWRLHNGLHTELGMKPWQWPALPECPFPPRSALAKTWQPDPEQQALWEALDAARRASAEQNIVLNGNNTQAEAARVQPAQEEGPAPEDTRPVQS